MFNSPKLSSPGTPGMSLLTWNGMVQSNIWYLGVSKENNRQPPFAG